MLDLLLPTYGIFVQTDDGPTSQHYMHHGALQHGVLSPTLFNLVLVGRVERMPSCVQISIYPDDICAWMSDVAHQVLAKLQRAAIPILMCLN